VGQPAPGLLKNKMKKFLLSCVRRLLWGDRPRIGWRETPVVPGVFWCQYRGLPAAGLELSKLGTVYNTGTPHSDLRIFRGVVEARTLEEAKRKFIAANPGWELLACGPMPAERFFPI